MPRHKTKSISDDDEVRSQKSHYTNVNKICSKHVELSLEVEMDDEVRDIIKSPEKCASALLDVTVIKPKGLDKYITETQTLKTDQVKGMIESMKLDNDDKKALLEKLFGATSDRQKEIEHVREKLRNNRALNKKRKSCLSSKNRNCVKHAEMKMDHGDVTEESKSVAYPMYTHQAATKAQQQQIYTTPKTYENIRSMFACTNKNEHHHNENDKLEQPCLCQNCAIVGILTDSQKKPFATEPIPPPGEVIKESKFRRPVRKKSVSFKHLEELPSSSRPLGTHETHVSHGVHGPHDQCQVVFKLLANRISELEKRVAMQEEKAVPKDYFKKIITKLVNHLTRLTHYTTEESKAAQSHRHKEPQSFSKYKSTDKYNRYYVNPVLVENSYRIPAEKEYDPKPCSSEEPPPKSASDTLWKWGEEFLTSGRDLKNKVVVLLEETLHSLKKGWEKRDNHDRYNEDVQSIVEELSKNLAQTVRPKSVEKKDPECSYLKDRRNISFYLPKVNEEASIRSSVSPRFGQRKGPTIKVAYVNPQLKKWPEESLVSFKIDSVSDYDRQEERMSEYKKKQYKKEFLKVLANTKTADKFKLWQSIWNQALENRQAKNDVVTIQIPDPKDLIRQKMISLDFTIGELEKMLTGPRNCDEMRKQ